MARVEVKSFSVPPEERLDMVIAWKDDGEAMFHDICWKAITDSYTMDNPFCFEAKEKEMVKEAWKTAEYYDSRERMEREAARIAKMLKSAKYGIAFTGECAVHIVPGNQEVLLCPSCQLCYQPPSYQLPTSRVTTKHCSRSNTLNNSSIQ